MRISNPKLLDEFRNAGRCEWCGKRCESEPHHASAKGMNSGKRIDIRSNLLAVGRSYPFPACPCHRAIQTGGKVRADVVLELISEREDTTPNAILETRWLFNRLPKNARLIEATNELAGESRRLFLREVRLAVSMGALTLGDA